MNEISIVIPGALHTDIAILGLSKIPLKNEEAYGPTFHIGPGGKSRNIAEMVGRLTQPGVAAMLSYTTRDPFGLWEPPYESLKRAGVSTEYVTVVDYEEGGDYPGIALMMVDTEGNRVSSVSNRIINNLTPSRIDDASSMFETAAKNDGFLVLSLEMPFETAVHSIEVAGHHGLRVLLDPGGIPDGANFEDLLKTGVFLIKPNEHEARMMTGITIDGMESAAQSAAILQEKGAENVFITHGEHGAYLFGKSTREHLVPVKLTFEGQTDSTGCGDQTMAALCAFLLDGKTIEEAAKLSILAGTMQFHRKGIQPVTKTEIETVLQQG